MARGVSPETVEIYQIGDSLKSPARDIWPLAAAQQAKKEKRGDFRNKQRKFVLFESSAKDGSSLTIDQLSSNPGRAIGLSARPSAGFMFRYANNETRVIQAFDASWPAVSNS